MNGPPAGGGMLPRSRRFRPHFWTYLAALALVLVANLWLGAGLPAFWPLAAWGVAVAIHYFIASSLDVNERWIDDRAWEVRTRSYDFDHIRNIRDRVAKRDDTVVHRVERDSDRKQGSDSGADRDR